MAEEKENLSSLQGRSREAPSHGGRLVSAFPSNNCVSASPEGKVKNMPVDMAPPQYGNLPQIAPPQSQNLLDATQQAQQIRQAQAMGPYQLASAQAGVQGQQLQNQQAQMEMDSQKGLMKAISRRTAIRQGDPARAPAWRAAEGHHGLPDKHAEHGENQERGG